MLLFYTPENTRKNFSGVSREYEKGTLARNGINRNDFRDLQTHHIETSQLIYTANKWTGFYMRRPENRFRKSMVRKSLLLHFPIVSWQKISDIWRFFTCSLQLIIIIIILHFTCKRNLCPCPDHFETKGEVFLTISTHLLKMFVKNLA